MDGSYFYCERRTPRHPVMTNEHSEFLARPRSGGPPDPPARTGRSFDCVIYVVNALLQIYSSF